MYATRTRLRRVGARTHGRQRCRAQGRDCAPRPRGQAAVVLGCWLDCQPTRWLNLGVSNCVRLAIREKRRDIYNSLSRHTRERRVPVRPSPRARPPATATHGGRGVSSECTGSLDIYLSKDSRGVCGGPGHIREGSANDQLFISSSAVRDGDRRLVAHIMCCRAPVVIGLLWSPPAASAAWLSVTSPPPAPSPWP